MNDQSSSDMHNVVISGNRAGRDGGGMLFKSDSNVNLINTTISGNTAVYHGGGIVNEASNINLSNVIMWQKRDFGNGYLHSNDI